MSALIQVSGLAKSFGPIRAVDGVSLEVSKGEVLGFLGPNGAGKSTTMKMVCGFLEPDAGTVRVAGRDMLADPRAAKAAIGYLPEGAPAYPEMTPLEFLRFMASVRGMSASAREAGMARVIELVHLKPVLHQSIETLSKGFKRRVGVASALLHDPEVLVMDEPTDGLDPNQKHEVRELIRSMAPHKAIVLSTHVLEEVEAVCNRVVIINQGKVVFDGEPQELESRAPAEVKTARLDWVFRQITTPETAEVAAAGGAA